MSGEILDFRGNPIKPAPRPSNTGGVKRCRCGVTISHNADSCFTCMRKRQYIHESAIVSKLAEMPVAERERKLELLPKAQSAAFRMRIQEYLDDREARFKPGRG